MNEDFLGRMVALANVVGKDLGALPHDSARHDMVKGIVGDAEVVFAVWKDRSAKNGVGLKLIKGQQLARQVLANNRGIPARLAAIPCMEAEQAEALLSTFAERYLRH